MAQFAVFRNPGRNPDILFVVQRQSTRLERAVGRLVMPLLRRTATSPIDHPLTPHLHVAGHDAVADPFDLATVAAHRLGDALCIRAEPAQDRVARALDELVSRA
ncbi:MAG: CcdB family protein [Rhodospirillales bacterium]|nr:CcdB family protein [Rhodospirillales bacterium]